DPLRSSPLIRSSPLKGTTIAAPHQSVRGRRACLHFWAPPQVLRQGASMRIGNWPSSSRPARTPLARSVATGQARNGMRALSCMTERLYLRLEGDATHGPESSAPADTLGALPVSPRLRKYVSQVIVYREQFACNAEVLERVLPDGAVRLVFNLADAPSANSDAGFRIEAVGACAAP